MSLLLKIKNLLFGSAHINTGAENTPHLIGICIRENLSYEKMTFSGDRINLKMSLSAAKKLCARLAEEDIECSMTSGGLSCLLGKYRKRWGLMAGTALIIGMLILSGNRVWDIRVSGNTVLTDAEVKAELHAVGFEKGSRIGARDVDEISNALLLASEKIAWMSINYRGNVAYVQIREKKLAESGIGEDTGTAANIISSRDGVIEYYEVLRGESVITEGQSVREGELLISGIIESSHGEIRTEHALGRVYAVTNRSFSVEIPLEYDKKVLSDPVCTQKTVKFFSNYINIFRKGGNLGATCVKIIEENSFSFFGLPPLPVSILSEMSMEYETVRERRSEAEASELAFFELENLLSSELREAELLRKTITTEITEGYFKLICDVVCLENIAVSVPIGEEKQ